MVLSLPPKETWLSSVIFPSDKAFHVKAGGENFTGAGPDFWARLQGHLRKSEQVSVLTGLNPPEAVLLQITARQRSGRS